MQEKDKLFLKNIKKTKTIVTLSSIAIYLIVIAVIIYKSLNINTLKEYLDLMFFALVIAIILRIIVRFILFELNKKLMRFAKGHETNVE